jgi:opacity protein-like surface antigen
MKKHFVFSAITLSSLFASVALADEPVYPPCNGNFGITYPNRCTPQPPTPDIPDEAFAPAPEVVFEVAPIQAPVQQTPAQAPCAETSPVPPLYQPNRLGQGLGRLSGGAPIKFGLFQNSNRVREVGARSIVGDGYGGSVYFRTHRQESRLGLELSVDAIDEVTLTQASIVAYSKRKYQGVIKPFAFVGGGAYVDTPGFSFQAGIGADVKLTQRLSLNVDARYLVAEEAGGGVVYEADCFDCYYSTQSFEGALMSMGLSWKFGAVDTQEKTLFQGKLLGSTASAFKSLSLSPNQTRPGFSQRGNQPQASAPTQGGLFKSRAPLRSSGLAREVGVRSFTDLDSGGEGGGGVYAKISRQNGRFGVEASLDAISADILMQTALLGYLNPKGIIRPYGLLGVGTEVNSGEITAQWGAGVDVAITKKVSLTADLRGIEGDGTFTTVDCDANGFCSDSFDYLSVFVGSFGAGYKF